MGNWTISEHGYDEAGKGKETLFQLYALFRLHFTPERNKHHSKAEIFNIKREPGESAAEPWKRILEIE